MRAATHPGWLSANDPGDRQILGGVIARLPGELRDKLQHQVDFYDRERVGNVLARIPYRFHAGLGGEYINIHHTQGECNANCWISEVEKLFVGDRLNFAADDDEIRDMAERAAREVREKLPHSADEEITRQTLARVAERYGITCPNIEDLPRIVARMTDPKWWRKRLRRLFRKIEHAAIRTGFVHRRAGLYVSDEAMKRRTRHKRRNARLMDGMEAVNELGEVFTLAELAATNVSNPAIRRAELMARLNGMERYADEIGFEKFAVHITTPSRMHAWTEREVSSGKKVVVPNPRYDGTRPDRASRYLCEKVWAPAQAKLGRDGVDYFGFRVAEPHHDGTPHWHMLLCVKPEHKRALLSTLSRYALRENPEEPGARRRRFKVKRIDPKRGSATGYFAKYISKNVDGAHVGDDFEADATSPATETAQRVEAWASLWHIRQFQFFGTPTVTPWRELRRLNGVPDHWQPLIGELWRAADAGDWCAYMKAYRDGARIRPLWEERQSASYLGETVKRVRGIIAQGDAGPLPIITREHEWIIREKDSDREARNSWKSGLRERVFASPWTCVNNSTQPVPQGPTREEPLTFYDEAAPPGEPQFDIGGLSLWKWKTPDGKEHHAWINRPGYAVGSFNKT